MGVRRCGERVGGSWGTACLGGWVGEWVSGLVGGEAGKILRTKRSKCVGLYDGGKEGGEGGKGIKILNMDFIPERRGKKRVSNTSYIRTIKKKSINKTEREKTL